MALRQPPLRPELKKAPMDVLAVQNGVLENWEWDDESRAVWKLAGKNWQKFKAKWYGTSYKTDDTLSLEHLPKFIRGNLSSIIVREAYVTMFDHVWARGLSSKGENGVIITGQPGTGKTLFQLYLLVRLLQRSQVVLFTKDGRHLYLFYGEVYTLDLANGALFPQPKSSSKDVFIWSLIDIKKEEEPDGSLVMIPCLPVQTASPNPKRYRHWKRERAPLFTGLPLWSHSELVRGLPHQPRYQDLMDAIHDFYDHQGTDIDYFAGVHGLLEERAKSDKKGDECNGRVPKRSKKG